MIKSLGGELKKLIIILSLLLSLSMANVTDIDGNVYETVLIGEQLWMAENLKVTHYNDGSEIPTGYSGSEWAQLETGAYAIYPTYSIDDASDTSETTCEDDCADVYGNLYNWYAVDDDRGVCPDGWHVPSDDEWTILTDFIAPAGIDSIIWEHSIAGGKMKEAGLDHWNYSSNEIAEEATNESGFTALPGGYRYHDGIYYYMSYVGYFWSSSEYYGSNSYNAWGRILSYDNSNVSRVAIDKQGGFSIRCLKD